MHINVSTHQRWAVVWTGHFDALISCCGSREDVKICFEWYGLPDNLVTDNGTSYKSDEMRWYLNFSEAENKAKIFKKTMMTVLEHESRNNRHIDLDSVLQRFVFDYHSTKHFTTKETPAKLLLRREFKKMSLLRPACTSTTVHVAHENQVKNYKGKRNDTYLVGNNMVIRNYAHPLHPKWEDAVVIEVLGPSNYKLDCKATV